MNRFCAVVSAAAGMLASGPEAWGWGAPHGLITGAALASLPGGEKEWLGAEFPRLGRDYCTIPDRVYADKELARYAQMETRPGVVYLTILHLPGSQPENFEATFLSPRRTVRPACSARPSTRPPIICCGAPTTQSSPRARRSFPSSADSTPEIPAR